MDIIDINNHDVDVRYPPLISDDNGDVSPDSSPLNAAANSTLQDPLPRSRSMAEDVHAKEPRIRKRHRPSVSTLLVVTNERLAQQTTLTRTLQAQSDDVFSVLKTTYQNNLNLQAHLTKAQSELALYRHQLQMAEGEIRRAEEIVKDVDRLRVQAEERSLRDREKLRKLVEERAVWVAKEEGRREGFQLGLEQGRRMVWALHANDTPRHSRADAEEFESTSSRSRTAQSTSTRSRARRTSMSSQARPPTPGRSASRNRPVEHEQDRPPRRRVPSGESTHHPRPEPETQHKPSSPEDIQPIPNPTDPPPIRPIPIQNRPPLSPALSHRDIVPPPDGYIPTKSGALGHEYITLPPPHELSIPVAPLEEGDTRNARPMADRRPRDDGDIQTPKQSSRSRGRARTISSVSGASTRVSEFDLVSPPRGAETRDPRFIHPIGTPSRVRSPSHKKVEEWRRNSAEVVSPQPRRMFTIANASSGDHIGEDSTDAEAPPVPTRTPQALRGPRPPKTPVNVTPATPITETRSMATTPPDPPIVQQLQDGNPPHRKTPLAWLRSRFQRSQSSPGGVANIQIQVEPPSASQSSTETNTGTIMDPVLLTPEHANRPFSPDAMIVEVDKPHGPPQNNPITIVLPDDNLPPGFVPQSPMMPLSMHTNIVAMNAAIPGPSSMADYSRSSPARPATASGARAASPSASFLSPMSRPLTSFGTYLSPAPLNRPISLFSDE